jgi:cation diffusion facilitator family transporter
MKPSLSASDGTSYAQEVGRTLFVVLFLNWAVSLLKLAVGYSIRSASMVADGYHSLADGASNIIGLLGMRLASQPKDADHPYGHKKYETFATTLIAFLLFLVCFHLLHDSFERLRRVESPRIEASSFLVMLLTIAVNVSVMAYEYRKGKKIGSDILVSDSMHTRADLLTSFSVLIAFIGVGLGYPFFDVAGALLIVCFIFASALQILRSSSTVLCDAAVIDSREIQQVVLSVPGVRRCHRIRTRGRQDDVHIDLHVLLEDRTPLVRAHDMSSKIEKLIKEKFAGVTDVVIHVEPLSSEGAHHDD